MDVEGRMEILQMHRSHGVDDAPWRYATEQTWEGGCLPEQRGFGRGRVPCCLSGLIWPSQRQWG